MVKGINNDLYKAAMKQKEDDAKRRQVAGIIQAIGGAGTSLIGAYHTSQEKQKDQAAAAQLGTTVGIDPEVAKRLDVGALASMAAKVNQSEILRKAEAQRLAGPAAELGMTGEFDPDLVRDLYHKRKLAEFEASLPKTQSPTDAAQAEYYAAQAAAKKYELSEQQRRAAEMSDPKVAAGRTALLNRALGGENLTAEEQAALQVGDPREFATVLSEMGKTSRLGTQIQSREGLAQSAADLRMRLAEAKSEVDKQRIMKDVLVAQAGLQEGEADRMARIFVALVGAQESPVSAVRDPNATIQSLVEQARSINPQAPTIQMPAGPVPGAPAVTAPPSAAPTNRVTATGPNGERVEWNGTEWVPIK